MPAQALWYILPHSRNLGAEAIAVCTPRSAQHSIPCVVVKVDASCPTYFPHLFKTGATDASFVAGLVLGGIPVRRFYRGEMNSDT